MPDSRNQRPSSDGQGSFGARIGIAASIVTVLAFFGITNWHSVTGDADSPPPSAAATITVTTPEDGGAGNQPAPTDTTPDDTVPAAAPATETTPANNEPCYDLVNNAQPQAGEFESYPPPLDSGAGNDIANQMSGLTAELQRDAQAEGVAGTRTDMAAAAAASGTLADDFRSDSNSLSSDQAALSSQMQAAVNDCQSQQ